MNEGPTGAQRDGKVNHVEISGWLAGPVLRGTTKEGKEFLSAKLALDNRSRISVKLWIEPSTSQDIIQEALSHKNHDTVVVEGSLSVWLFNGSQYVGINAERIG